MTTILNALTSSTGLAISPDSSGVLQLQSNGTPTVTVDTSGNVGIGTSSPGVILDVKPASLGNTSGNYTFAYRAITNTGNQDALDIFWTRTASAVGWTNADLVIQRNVDATNGQGQIRFGGENSVKFYTNSAERVRIDSSGSFLMNSGYGSVAIAYGCRAWVSFIGNGANGAASVNASGNVSGVTKNNNGDYTVSYANAMPDANYASCINYRADQSGGGSQPSWGTSFYRAAGTIATGSARVMVGSAGGSAVEIYQFSVFR